MATPSPVAAQDRHENRSTGGAWSGWIMFACTMMFILGCFHAIAGFVGIFEEDYYQVGENGLVVSVDYTVWGFVHLFLGAAIFLSGIGVMSGNLAARSVGVLLAGLNALVALVFIEAAPGWGVIVVVVDTLVIYALTVHGRELRNSSR